MELVNYFKYKPYINEVITNYKYSDDKLCLTTSFKELVDNLWPSANYSNYHIHQNSNNKYYAPYNFKEKISQMESLFQGAQANDSKDLVNFIIMTLHEELNKSPKSAISNNNNIFIDQTNKEMVLTNFVITITINIILIKTLHLFIYCINFDKKENGRYSSDINEFKSFKE